jgi:FKBP-type peptidyl-prolyl cis-trans isomerase
MGTDHIYRNILIQAVFVLLLVSCNSGQETKRITAKPGRNEMTELNRYLVQKDKEIIQNYIERKELKMTESSTGLWYSVISPGNGHLLKDNDRILIDYECSLLDGTICYSSDNDGSKGIIIGKTKIEQGLDEGLRLLSPGAEAIFILPPFLAYGLVGDGKKIPPREIIVFKIKVLKDNNQN